MSISKFKKGLSSCFQENVRKQKKNNERKTGTNQ